MKRGRLDKACADECPEYDDSDRVSRLCTTCEDDFTKAVREIAEMIRETIWEANTTPRSWGSPLRLYEEDIELDTDPYEFFLYGGYYSNTLIVTGRDNGEVKHL